VNARQAAAERRVIDAAKRFERAGQYGIDAGGARREYDDARDEQARVRQEEAA
jgi:hypothetical protein